MEDQQTGSGGLTETIPAAASDDETETEAAEAAAAATEKAEDSPVDSETMVAKPSKPARRRRLLGNRRTRAAAKPKPSAEPATAEAAIESGAASDTAEAAKAEDDTVEAAASASETDSAEAGAAEAETDSAAAGEADADTDSAESSEAETDTDSAESGEAETDPDSDESAESEAKEPAKGVRRRKLNRRRLAVAAAAVMSLLFIGSAAFAGASVQPYLADRATVAVKLKVAQTAAHAITTLWTYTPEDMDKLADRAATYLSGDFGAQYRKFVDQIVAPNKQAQVTNNTEVTGVAVESLDRDNAVAIVYTNTVTTSPLTKNIPSTKYFSYRLILRRDQDRWLVTRMTTITTLDFTPRL